MRISYYQTGVKRVAMSHVAQDYGLSDKKTEREGQVERLLLHDMFIFLPKDEVCFLLLFVHGLICVMQGIDPKKPFHHLAIVNTIRESFFKRKRGPSIAQKHQSLFSSSLDTGMAAEEVELPPAMVAMAAVAASLSLPHRFYTPLTSHDTNQVLASLDEKATGVDFNADTYEDSYDTFISFLAEIRKQRLGAYHRLMSDLFKFAS